MTLLKDLMNEKDRLESFLNNLNVFTFIHGEIEHKKIELHIQG